MQDHMRLLDLLWGPLDLVEASDEPQLAPRTRGPSYLMLLGSNLLENACISRRPSQ